MQRAASFNEKAADYVESALELLVGIYPQNAYLAVKATLDLLAIRLKFFEREWPHPSPLSYQLCSLIRRFGLQQVLREFENGIKERVVPEAAQEQFNEFIHYAKESKVQGYDL